MRQSVDSKSGRSARPDRRKQLRAPLIVRRVKLDVPDRTFFGYTKNLSRSGMFIASTNPRQPGSRFRVEIPLPPPLDRRVECECEVVWHRLYSRTAAYEPGMGLRFLDLPEGIADSIDEWIRSTEDPLGIEEATDF